MEDVSDLEISTEIYAIVRHDRNRHGGGVLMYIHTSLTCKIFLRGLNNPEFLSLSIVSQFCTVPPSTPVSFLIFIISVLHYYFSPHLL